MECTFRAEFMSPQIHENNRLPRIGRGRKVYVTVRFRAGLSEFAAE